MIFFQNLLNSRRMSENFFGLLQKIKCLKHFAMVFYWMHTKDESQLICLFECLPSLQSLEVTIKSFDQASYFKCLEECISRSSLEKFHLEVCNPFITLVQCLLTTFRSTEEAQIYFFLIAQKMSKLICE